MQRIFTAIVIAIIAGAIGKGIISAFALDAKVARMIHVVRETYNLSAISWTMSGLFGLFCLVLWLSLRVDERIYNFFAPQPELGSLVFEAPFIPRINRSKDTGRVDIELVTKLKNTNQKLIRTVGIISGAANGKPVAGDQVPIDSLVPAGNTTSLIIRIANIPMKEFVFGTPSVAGHFYYKLSYAFPPNESRSRETSKKISWQLNRPLLDVKGATETYDINVIFSEESEK